MFLKLVEFKICLGSEPRKAPSEAKALASLSNNVETSRLKAKRLLLAKGGRAKTTIL